METVAKALKTREEYNETNDCGVISISQVAGRTYREVLEESYKLGRKKGRGMPWSVVEKLCKKYNIIKVDVMKKYNGMRPRAWWFLKEHAHIKQPIIIDVRGHFFVAKEGKEVWGMWKDKALVRNYYIKGEA